jgi:hypothetical protein
MQFDKYMLYGHMHAPLIVHWASTSTTAVITNFIEQPIDEPSNKKQEATHER